MIRTALLTVIFIAGFLSSCTEQEQLHLPPDKMTKVMTDIYLAEVYSSLVNDSVGMSVNKNMDSLAVYYKTVLHHHGISLDEFSSSLRWYSAHPAQMDTVYINVLNELSTMEGLLNVESSK
jgi:hypothetical protein